MTIDTIKYNEYLHEINDYMIKYFIDFQVKWRHVHTIRMFFKFIIVFKNCVISGIRGKPGNLDLCLCSTFFGYKKTNHQRK